MTLLFATLLHPLVDACSATVLVAGGFSWKRALVYNIIAFALQLPLGVVLDACPTLLKPAFATGIASTLGGIFACLCGFAGWGPLVAVCAGNALFHLTAGKSILDTWPDRSAPSGVFIATGALGLFAGLQFGGKHTVWCAAGFGVALTLAALCAWFKGPFRTTEVTYLRIRGWLGPGILTGLFSLVVWRSWAGLFAGVQTNAAGFAFACAGVVATWAGKTAGGYLADKVGRAATVLASTAGSLALCFCCRPEQTYAWLALLFVAQLATGPVLSWLYDATGRAGGTAFGINCFGLFAGSLR